ncbi:MAG: signal peptidase II [Candidatus Omnitrophica bacterium]|nr:signal peptidase II [Candidatus Omnitrophota bacterium]MCM8831002.1 signal peptidase II [Candidatus Omnitrophota bacterium]
MKNFGYSLVVLITAICIFAIDSFVKYFLFYNFSYTSIPLIKNILHITVICNSGAAFGLLRGKNQLLIYISIIFILFFLILSKRSRKTFLAFFGEGLIIGGAISNLFDRLFLGCVIDYIDIRIWPVFNISDMCISIGIGVLFLDSLKNKKLKT